MKRKWLSVMLLLAVGLLGSVSADDQNNWIGGVGDWNVASNWSLGYVPDTLAPTVDGRNVGLAGDTSVATVSINTEFGDPGGGWSDFYGPEWGATLNVDGASLTHYGFAFAPIGDDAAHSTINVSNGGALTVGELLIGDNWWFAGHPYVDLNVYDTSTVNARGWSWLGGTMNLYGGTVDIAGGMNFATANGYAGINIEDGMLIIRDDTFTAATAQAWEDDGFLTGFGGSGDVIIDDSTGDLVITAVIPEPATMLLLGLGSLAMFRHRR